MKQFSFLFLAFLLLSVTVSAQKGTLQGKVIDAISKETIINVNVVVEGDEGTGTVTDIDGYYQLKLAPGTYNVTAKFVGYKEKTLEVTVNENILVLDFELEEDNILMGEFEVVADVAQDRETPVAFSTVPLERIQEEISVQDLPMVLNSTPGVYATQQGGGDGDARITIRGFNQRNVAILIDGVPVNDMENGWVYWSNWSGLQGVARSMQVQRGLGASKLALPSVGGTINLLTKGIEAKRRFNVRQSVGVNGYLKTQVSGTTGRLENGWGLTFTGAYRRGNGWVDQTWSEAWFYFVKLEKMFNKHSLSFSVVGAPQSHGQRSFKSRIAVYDKEFAAKMFEGSSDLYKLMSDYSQGNIAEDDYNTALAAMNLSEEQLQQAEYSFVDTASISGDYGIRYNRHWGYLQRNGATESELLTERVNIYHKPQFTLKDFWQPNDKFALSNMLYLSLGNGGGVGSKGSGFAPDRVTGQLDVQSVYDQNQSNPIFGCAPCGTVNILRRSVNSHVWYGMLSTFDYEANEHINVSGGLDLRNYRGIHYRDIYDLLGGSHFGQPVNETNPLYVGDTIDYHNDGFVKWGGIFGQVEYKNAFISSFLNITGALSQFQREDFFIADSARLSDKVNVPGFTIKTGANFNLTESQNVFFNTGYLNKAPGFDFIFNDNTNQPYGDIVNEQIIAFELGYGYKSPRFALNTNAYYTSWLNRPLISSIEVESGERESVNIAGMRALHRGVEMDFACEVIPKKLKWEGLLSVGDWIWKTDSSTLILADELANIPENLQFSANGVHVGDAAQFQAGTSIRVEPIKGLYGNLKWTYFGKNFADFDPSRLTGGNADRESWQLPDYYLVDFHAGYRFKVKETKFSISGSILNLLNNTYISDASTRAGFDLDQIEVFFGAGRRFSSSLSITF